MLLPGPWVVGRCPPGVGGRSVAGRPVASRAMKQRHLGRRGLIVSRLALGTMTWGRDTDEDDAAAQLIAFREAGRTLIDTSDTYVDGESERVLGRLLQDVVRRDE